MIGASKDWVAFLGFDRETDERVMAARSRVLARALNYLSEHFSDPTGRRPSEALVMEVCQFLALAEAAESKGRGGKFKELYEAIVQLHEGWDQVDRDEIFDGIARTAALFRGSIAFSDAWLGSETSLPDVGVRDAQVEFDATDVKTRIVRPSQLRAQP